jgi:hypothetical protein
MSYAGNYPNRLCLTYLGSPHKNKIERVAEKLSGIQVYLISPPKITIIDYP